MQAILIAALLAADWSGRWKSEWKTVNVGTVKEYLVLRTSGGAVTGNFIDGFGKAHEVRDGKLTADGFTFWMVWETRGGKAVRTAVVAVQQGDALAIELNTPGQPRSLRFVRASAGE